ncbi:hypothetical protein ED733_003927 [Metarhizium rileyi]|uniref:Fatty acid hydroxylase domain-containing protein n=1 Tax=Metarhizium rileyi (strain RCEF 4871) TaxID=1649241 RepID=A0A5C6GEX3_METRR|nr:hypothetical protein ED733_003927 [Metarhizium rileyi]
MTSRPNPKDSMKSTWRLADRSTWTREHWLIELLNAHPVELDKPIPVHPKTDKMPHVSQWSQHLWILAYALLPLAVEQSWISLTGGQSLGSLGLFALYFAASNVIVIREVHILRRLGHKYGFLDGDVHERDGVPDVGVAKVASSLVKTTGSRIVMALYLTRNHQQSPAAAVSSWQWWAWLALENGAYSVILDFWFYWYHRAMHDIPFLWKFHRTHHLTKHPNPLLAAYADHEQEFFDMVGVPFLTYMTLRAMGLPLGFHEWWICHQYVVYSEVWGHSGVRANFSPPSTFIWILDIFNMDLVGEDHDLHHRKGWRKSFNYGKQTRVWDRIFGTCSTRIESVSANVDYKNPVTMPLV